MSAKNTSIFGKIRKGTYIIAGTMALIAGIIGIFLPVIPTTPFVLLASACYLRGSQRLHEWILAHEWFGDTIRNYEAGKGLKKATKIKAISLMWLAILVSAIYYVESMYVKAAMGVVSVAVTVYLLNLPIVKD
ncbi:MAG: YbaN family protein [Candidatus Bathyarchaeota archaeon]|nr:YbaN family protein [Candidatus Bathyarchaeota archaeon]